MARHYKYITFSDRREIAVLYQANERPADIAERLGVQQFHVPVSGVRCSMGKKSDYLARQEEKKRTLQEATRQTFVQCMTDTLVFTLNDSEVMGKDVFGYVRLKKVLDARGWYYDQFFDAMTKKPEADYARAKMDEALKRICGETGDFVPFEKRYDWLPEIRYGHKP